MRSSSFSWILSASLLPLIVASGCGSDESSPAPTPVVTPEGGDSDAASPDVVSSDTTSPEASEGGDALAEAEVDAETGPVEPPQFEAPPAVAVSTPEPFPVAEWVTGAVWVTDDQVYPLVEQGQFELPKAEDFYGNTTWYALTPGAHGELDVDLTDIVYGAAKITPPQGRNVLARADRVVSLYVANSEIQPGDYYAFGTQRVPLDAKGETLVVARMLGGKADPAVELWTTPDEVYFNLADATLPDLVVGADYEQWIGVPILNFSDQPIVNVRTVVVGSADVQESVVIHPSLPPHAVTQAAFQLRPAKAPTQAGGKVKVKLRLEPDGLQHSYEVEVEVPVVAADAVRRHTRRSAVDGSVQFYGVLPPSNFDASKKYGLILSLHGAGVDAAGQAGAYGPKSWAWLVAPTNRRPFGFDWEEWGRRDAIEALDHASAAYGIDPTRVHLTGHSMGGHGSWHVGEHFTYRFATINPSAGWSSFESYGGESPGKGTIGRARAASVTLNYTSNLANRGIYILHGDKDESVPLSEAQLMYDNVSKVTTDITFHIQPGATHWWDDDPNTPGVACVDWGPMMQSMETHTLDPVELDFSFRTPMPWVSPTRSYITVRSCTSPMQDCEVTSKAEGSTVVVTTKNVRTLELNAKALSTKSITKATVDGKDYPVAGDTPIAIGPGEGKTLEVSGPINQAFTSPFCYVYDSNAPLAFRRHVSSMTSTWSLLGNGQACAVTLDKLTPWIRSQAQLIYVGIPSKSLPAAEAVGFKWDSTTIQVGDKTFPNSALLVVFPENGKLSAAIMATASSEYLLQRYDPFSSRSGMPDWFVYNDSGLAAAGFFDANWKIDPASSDYKK